MNRTTFDSNNLEQANYSEPDENDVVLKQYSKGSSRSTRHDEVYDENNEIRPNWRYLLDSLQALGSKGIQERQDKVTRLLRNDGATFKVYKTPQSSSHTWRLNPVPLVIGSAEWSLIETGLLERAQLFDLILRDIYGEQKLIKHGIIPPELLYSHRGFLRSCHGIKLPGENQLITYAADMVRAADGSMIVIDDKTQIPTGAGYALENRTVMTRVFPSLFRDSHVHRLAHFFYQLRYTLNQLSPNTATPRVVILTPGAFNEAHFEHAYLANYLGFPLVQGNDLTVRNGYVWLKSLDGLKRVDVILRRVDDTYCDPVELRGDSHLGIPGLLSVVRAGHVSIANPLGSGVLENSGLYRYLPEISKYFLGRELKLKTARTWWCGDKHDLKYVLAHISELIIKPCYQKSSVASAYGAELSESALNEWRKRIIETPERYVAQEYIPCALSPTWDQGSLVARPSVLRTFAVASGNSYIVMPGGLTRASLDVNAVRITSQSGAISKDTWVLASEPEKVPSASRSQKIAAGVTDLAEMSSRVTEKLFWMGRYAERAESSMRLLRTVFVQTNKVEPMSDASHQTLLRAVTHLTSTYPGFTVDNPNLFKQPQQELFDVIANRNRIGSLAYSIVNMLNAAEQVSEQLSSDTQRIVNNIGDELVILENSFKSDGWYAAPEEALNTLVTELLAISGLIQESMVRSYGWHFIKIGHHNERALQIINLIRSLLVNSVSSSDEETLVESALLCCETLITYRRRYRDTPNLSNGLDLLLMDSRNPRSLVYQLKSLDEHFSHLPKSSSSTKLLAHEKHLLEAQTVLQLSDLRQLVDNKSGTIRHELDQLLARLQHLIGAASTSLTDRYFDHKEESSQLFSDNGSWQDEL